MKRFRFQEGTKRSKPCRGDRTGGLPRAREGLRSRARRHRVAALPERKRATASSLRSSAKSASVGSCGLSRRALTMHRKPSGSLRAGAELVPGPGRHGDEVVELDLAHLAPDETFTAPAKHHHGMHMLMAFERREAAGRDLEIAKLRIELGVAEEDLTRHRLEEGPLVLLVGPKLHLFPAMAAAPRDGPVFPASEIVSSMSVAFHAG